MSIFNSLVGGSGSSISNIEMVRTEVSSETSTLQVETSFESISQVSAVYVCLEENCNPNATQVLCYGCSKLGTADVRCGVVYADSSSEVSCYASTYASARPTISNGVMNIPAVRSSAKYTRYGRYRVFIIGK